MREEIYWERMLCGPLITRYDGPAWWVVTHDNRLCLVDSGSRLVFDRGPYR